MKRAIQSIAVGALLMALSAQASVIELDCEMKMDLVSHTLQELPRAQSARLKEELEKSGVLHTFYTLDTKKRTLRIRFLDRANGGYQWRTIKDMQKRTLPDGVIAYTYERDEKGSGDMKAGKEMLMIAPEVKTVIHTMYWVMEDDQEGGTMTRGACK
jgi:hypothetical protein